jgi:hypothetical protein
MTVASRSAAVRDVHEEASRLFVAGDHPVALDAATTPDGRREAAGVGARGRGAPTGGVLPCDAADTLESESARGKAVALVRPRPVAVLVAFAKHEVASDGEDPGRAVMSTTYSIEPVAPATGH